MWDSIRLAGRYMAVSIRAQMQYRASFAMLALGHFVSTGIEAVGIVALFARFESLQGWRLAEIALFYGLINVAFAVAEMFGRGFDTFPQLVKNGDFDRILVRPRAAAFQIAMREVQLMRLGRFAQGALVLAWGIAELGIEWTPARVGLLAFAIFGGAALFVGLFVIQATIAFWTTESLEIMNTVTYGGTETAQYPLSIYEDWFQKFFTVIVPLACVSYFPVLAILDRPDTSLGSPTWFGFAAPAIGFAFLTMALFFWRFGVRHYLSTGS